MEAFALAEFSDSIPTYWKSPFGVSPLKNGSSLSRAGRVRLSIFDVMGRNVRTLIDSECAAGQQTVEWNGLCDNGKLARSGVYVVMLVAEGRQLHRKLLVTR